MSGEDRADEPAIDGDGDDDRDRTDDRPSGGRTEDGPESKADAGSADEGGPNDDRPAADDGVTDEAVDESTIEALEETIDDREAEIDDLTARLKRVQADFQNYKKRTKRRQEEERQRATESLVERLLDVRDNLSRALDDENADVETLREGVKMTLAELDRVLDAEAVTRIEPDPGEEVDPRRHEVMMRVESDRPADAIASVYAPGYEMGEKLLRPAQVTVSDGSGEDEVDGEAPADGPG